RRRGEGDGGEATRKAQQCDETRVRRAERLPKASTRPAAASADRSGRTSWVARATVTKDKATATIVTRMVTAAVTGPSHCALGGPRSTVSMKKVSLMSAASTAAA